MFKKDISEVVDFLAKRASGYGSGCERVYVSLSGGVDSAVVAMILSRAFGPEKVVAAFRDIRSNNQHYQDSKMLAEAFGFTFLGLNLNSIYDAFLAQCRDIFEVNGIPWMKEAYGNGDWANAYASLKSRMMTPFAGFISKAVDGGKGRIFGTGNLEEDFLLRYYDKFGDGAVDNNILSGLTKMEVRQIALWFGCRYGAPICRKIAEKIPSADLQANGNAHNDEGELSALAKTYGFELKLSYGDCEKEGNIAWACKEQLDRNVVRGANEGLSELELKEQFGYDGQQVEIIRFMRIMEKNTRHKELGIPGISRQELRQAGLVD